MLQVEEALAAVLSAAAPARAAPRDVPLHEALGLVLAEDVRAHDPLPPFRASIKVCRPRPPLAAFLPPLSISYLTPSVLSRGFGLMRTVSPCHSRCYSGSSSVRFTREIKFDRV